MNDFMLGFKGVGNQVLVANDIDCRSDACWSRGELGNILRVSQLVVKSPCFERRLRLRLEGGFDKGVDVAGCVVYTQSPSTDRRVA